MGSKDVNIVIVTYNSSKFIEKCLKTLKDYKVIVVDNNSKDNTLEIVNKYKNARIISNNRNFGYATAANIGIKNSKFKYILLTNPDTCFKSDSLPKMVEFMENNPKCDVQGPKLLNDNNELVYSCKRFPTLKAMIGNRLYIFKKEVEKYLMKDYDHKKPRKVDWVSGGCMMFKQKFLFDERYFLYFEDVDFCLGKNVWYNPNSIAYHTIQRESVWNPVAFVRHFVSMIKFRMKNKI